MWAAFADEMMKIARSKNVVRQLARVADKYGKSGSTRQRLGRSYAALMSDARSRGKGLIKHGPDPVSIPEMARHKSVSTEAKKLFGEGVGLARADKGEARSLLQRLSAAPVRRRP